MLKYSEFKLYLTVTFSPEILSLNEEIPALYWYPNLNCNDLNDIPRDDVSYLMEMMKL